MHVGAELEGAAVASRGWNEGERSNHPGKVVFHVGPGCVGKVQRQKETFDRFLVRAGRPAGRVDASPGQAALDRAETHSDRTDGSNGYVHGALALG